MKYKAWAIKIKRGFKTYMDSKIPQLYDSEDIAAFMNGLSLNKVVPVTVIITKRKEKS